MTAKKKLKQESNISVLVPAPVTLLRLREHFRNTYSLTEHQVEIMVVSSSRSLEQGLAHLQEVLTGGEPVERLGAIYHGLKGLFLNMGEAEWAVFAKKIEQKILVDKHLDHKLVAEILHNGVVEVLTYCGKQNAGFE